MLTKIVKTFDQIKGLCKVKVIGVTFVSKDEWL